MRRFLAAACFALFGVLFLNPGSPAKADPVSQFLFGGHSGIGKYKAAKPRKATKSRKVKNKRKAVKRKRYAARQRSVKRSGWNRPARATTAARSAQRRSAAGLPAPVRSALASVQARCAGYRLVSTHRPGARIAGTRRVSLHASNQAADFVVRDYRCAYRVLAGWRYGLSMDAWRAKHIHISYSPHRNEGRFVHRHLPRTSYASARRRRR